jgi:tryptophanase
VIDATRFAENAWFIQQREPEYAQHSIPGIVREMMDCADIPVMSSKKDGLVNFGGFCAFRNDQYLFRAVQERCVVSEGFITYSGLAGRHIEALALVLEEAINPDSLAYCIGQP